MPQLAWGTFSHVFVQGTDIRSLWCHWPWEELPPQKRADATHLGFLMLFWRATPYPYPSMLLSRSRTSQQAYALLVQRGHLSGSMPCPTSFRHLSHGPSHIPHASQISLGWGNQSSGTQLAREAGMYEQACLTPNLCVFYELPSAS